MTSLYFRVTRLNITSLTWDFDYEQDVKRSFFYLQAKYATCAM